jgi:phosphatidylglycerophosphate synthase
VSIADQLTVARIAAAPLIVLFYILDFQNHDY